jgi:hypothetical protein
VWKTVVFEYQFFRQIYSENKPDFEGFQFMKQIYGLERKIQKSFCSWCNFYSYRKMNIMKNKTSIKKHVHIINYEQFLRVSIITWKSRLKVLLTCGQIAAI